MRAGHLADLDADAVVQIGTGHWLRIPLGKLRNDRYVPLHPDLITLLAAWTAARHSARPAVADAGLKVPAVQVGRRDRAAAGHGDSGSPSPTGMCCTGGRCVA
jgi:integrase